MLVDDYNDYPNEVVQKDEPPVDKFGMNYIIATMLGAGTLFAYNAVIAGGGYYQSSFPDKKLEYLAPLVTSIVSPVLQFGTVHFNRFFGKSACLYLTLIGNAISVALIPIVVSNLSLDDGFIAALTCMLAIGALGAINLGTVFSLFSIFPFHFLQAVMAGQGWSGVIVSVLRAVSKAVYGEGEAAEEKSVRLYFFTAAGFTLLCVVAFTILQLNPFGQFYLSKSVDKKVSVDNNSLNNDVNTPLVNGEHYPSEEPEERVPLLSTLRTILPAIANVAGVFIVTFLCFPGLMFAFKPTIDMTDEWFGIVNMMIFNIFDLIGRSLPSVTLLWNEKNVHVPIIIRVVVYPLFLLAAKSDIEFFNHSYFVFGLLAVFAITNGYLSSIVMMTAGNLVTDREKEAASSFMSASLTASILVGSTLAVFADKINW